MEEEREKLYIPVNVRERNEWFPGYGFQEFIPTVIVGILSLIMGVVVGTCLKNAIPALLVTSIPTMFTVIILTKNSYGENVIDILKNIVEYRKTQKIYEYYYLDEFKKDKLLEAEE